MQNGRLRAELIVDRPRIPPDFRCEKIDHDRWSVGRGIGTRMTVDFISKPELRLSRLLRYNLRTIRAYLLKEAFQQLGKLPEPESTHDFF